MFGDVINYNYSIDNNTVGNTFVVPDLHGCLHTFEKILTIINFGMNDRLILLGDLINRGSHSLSLVKTVVHMQKEGYDVHLIRGNHENQIAYYASKTNANSYLSKTELAPLFSGNEFAFFKSFFSSMPFYIENENNFFVHAGFCRLRDPFVNYYDMLHIREMQYDETKHKGKRIFHGHTPINYNIIKNRVRNREPVINLDNGCVLKKKYPEKGSLLCLELSSLELIRQKNIDT